MITHPAPPRSQLTKPILALVVAAALVIPALGLVAVAVTMNSGIFDQVSDGVEDAQAAAKLRDGACLADLPRPEPGNTDRFDIPPPKVVDCEAENAIWIIDDETPGVPVARFDRLLEDDSDVDASEFCDTDPSRLVYVYGWVEYGGQTVTAYCIVRKPIGWFPENK